MDPRPLVELHLRASSPLVPLVSSAVEAGARVLGLDEPDAAALGLGAEEVFSHLAAAAAPGRDVEVRLAGGGWLATAEFAFVPDRVDWRPLNLTYRTNPANDPLLTRTGLAIAARVVDRFRLARKEQRVVLALTKERRFPTAPAPPDEPAPTGPVSARPARPHELALAAGLAAARYPAEQVPPGFDAPGKVEAMARSGDLAAAVAVDAAGRLAGAVFWTVGRMPLAELSGPYLFQEPPVPDAAALLVDACLGALGRTSLRGVLARNPTEAFPPRAFEPLGLLHVPFAGGSSGPVEARYRELGEDPGCAAHVSAPVEPFVRGVYERLALARIVRTAPAPAVAPGDTTAFATRLDRRTRQATLTPLWLGPDAPEAIGALVDLLASEGLTEPTAELDLGEAWQAGFAPALLGAGFAPRLVLPWAGTGDVLVLQRTAPGTGGPPSP